MPPNDESLFGWIIEAIGLVRLIFLLVAAVVSLTLSLFALYRSKGTTAGALLLTLIPLPLVIAVLVCLNGMIAAASVIAASSTPIKPDELALGTSFAMATPLAGLSLTLPTYLIVACVMTRRALSRPKVVGKKTT